MIDLLLKVLLKSLEDVRQKELFLKFMGLLASGTFPLHKNMLPSLLRYCWMVFVRFNHTYEIWTRNR
jgi:hypothetical protein